MAIQITPSTQVVGVKGDDLSLTSVQAILENSPALVYAPLILSLAKKWRVRVSFALAQFLQESALGSAGIAVKAFNPAGMRSSVSGLGEVKSGFVYFNNWKDGFTEYFQHLAAPGSTYVKERRRTIEKIIGRWAPAEDGNQTEKYIKNVITWMGNWTKEGSNNMADLFPTAADLGLPANMVRIHKAADIGPWRPLTQVKFNIAHDTQGGFAGSESTLTAADSNVASCHILINTDGYTVLCVPLDYTAWTPGNDFYAERGINIEMVGWQTGPYTEAQYRVYAAYYRWAVAQGCPIANAYIGRKGLGSGHLGHEDVPNPFGPGYGGRSGHTDPGAYWSWPKFVEYCGGKVAVFDPNPKKLDVGPGMLDYAKLHQLKFVVAEQFFSPDANQPGLGKMSRAWAQDSNGVTYVLMASELVELAKPGEDTPWKIEQLELV